MASSDRVTAAVLIIGDEILSGRTQDTNLNFIAKYLGTYGVDLAEARVVPDIEDEIVTALNHLRGRYDYVITTGGIGPTHDDITADSVAKAFGVSLYEHPDIIAMMTSRWAGELNAARRRMARVPEGGSLVIGEIVSIHINEEHIKEGRLDRNSLDLIGRMGGIQYTRTTERFEMARPKVE